MVRLIESTKLATSNNRILLELNRSELVRATKSGSPTRYNSRTKYAPSDYHGVDLADLFINDTLTFTTPVGGYKCTISFKGVFKYLRKYVGQNPKAVANKNNKINLDLKQVTKALSEAYDNADVLVDCTCPDFVYRFAYWATQKGYKYGAPQNEPAKKTNPNNKLGSQCKHLTALLSNKKWIVKVASIVNKYLTAHPDQANDYLLLKLPLHDDPQTDEEE